MRPIVPESKKTEDARQKLQERFDKQQQKITEADIEKARASIHRWIADNSKDRVPVKGKFGLFNENQDPAEVSGKVSAKAKELLA